MPEIGAEARARAARAVAAVRTGQSLDAALLAARAGIENDADRGLIAALSFGVLRDWRLLTALSAPLLRKPPEPAIAALIAVGLYQLRALRVPPHAAVNATVAAAALLGRGKARGLVNAVLRGYQRQAAALEAALDAAPGLVYSHPDWLVTQLRCDWPQDWQAVLAANNRVAPMTLRVNRRQTNASAYRCELADLGLSAQRLDAVPDAVVLADPVAVEALPGFATGRVSVQDAAAQLAAPLLEIAPGMRVLDACSAPGGKAGHCLELADCRVTAVDSDDQRLTMVAETLRRLDLPGSDARLVHADALDPQSWWDGDAYQRILLDAPCSGTGVIRRHPDIKWLRRAADVAASAERQRRLLEALWPLLAPAGVLVYATCSTLRAEGVDVVAAFCAGRADVVERPITADWGQAETVGRRIAPGEHDMDGFYHARLVKRAI